MSELVQFSSDLSVRDRQTIKGWFRVTWRFGTKRFPTPGSNRDRMQGLTPNPPPGGGGRRTPEGLKGMARAVAIRAEAGLKPALTRLQTTRASLLLKPRTQPATPAGLLRTGAPCENRVVAASRVRLCRV